MYGGDRARKATLIDYGFRLPSAADNRPLRFDEFEDACSTRRSSSAPRPAPTSTSTAPSIVEQIIRPTGLIDPTVEVRPIEGQIDDLLDEIKHAGRARASACW